MIISFSGLDGSGKTTQIQLLLVKFKKMGFDCRSIYDIKSDLFYDNQSQLIEYKSYFGQADIVHTRFRMNSKRNNSIMNLLEHGEIPNPSLSKQAALQAYYDYLEWHEIVMNPIIDTSKIIIYDRCFFDELAFKGLYGCDENYISKIYKNIITPDISFYLSIEPEIAFYRNKSRPDSQINLYKNIKYTKLLKQRFDIIACKNNMTVLNGVENPENLHRQILSKIQL